MASILIFARALPAAALLTALAVAVHAEQDAAAPATGGNAAQQRQAEKGAGGSYVPLESWVYKALDQLAALGFIPSQISGLRPWTRTECLRQALEAEKALESGAMDDASYRRAREMVSALVREFAGNVDMERGIVLESLYARNGFIAGPALTDGFHFGQTWRNDSGRPFGRGWNSYEGFTARAQSKRFFAYVQGEVQHAPGAEAYSQGVREAISRLDGAQSGPAVKVGTTDRFRLLDTYAGVRLGEIQFSVGKQSMWWGPTYDAPLSFSNNAEPTKNFKASLVDPIRLPGVFRYLGKIRGEFVIGKLGGHAYTWRPWFNAQKLSFKLTENLEMGFTRWSIFWGVGHPITVRSFIRNFTAFASPEGTSGYGSATDPGDRKGGFDFRYRVPGMRNWLTLYTDSYCDDDPSPLANPRRAGINPGIYLARVPGAGQVDLRVEAPSTRPLDGAWDYPGLNYSNTQYRSGNTNYGVLLGNPVGRAGRAIEGWIGYHFSPRSQAQFGYRRLIANAKFLGGGAQNDAAVKASMDLTRHWRADWLVQRETFYIPLLGPRRSSLSGWIQLTWEPNVQLSGQRN